MRWEQARNAWCGAVRLACRDPAHLLLVDPHLDLLLEEIRVSLHIFACVCLVGQWLVAFRL